MNYKNAIFVCVMLALSVPAFSDDELADSASNSALQDDELAQGDPVTYENIPNILVIAKPLDGLEPFETTYSISSRDREDIERFQPIDVFQAVRDIPGVSISGGPLIGGKKFNIRGFSDTADVSVELDGVPRDFEKYRFGAGVFIDPDLLGALEIWRQPSIRITPGSIGGAVRAWSLNPNQILEGGERIGGNVKIGYGTNADQKRYAGSVVVQPTESAGALVAVSKIQSDDLTLGNGETLPNSSVDSESYLAKVTWTPMDDTDISVSYQGWKNESLQPYDAFSGEAGAFGNLRRDVDDNTLALVATSELTDWFSLYFSSGISSTKVLDTLLISDQSIASPDSGVITDNYDYGSKAFRFESVFSAPSQFGFWTIYLGIDGLNSERDVSRVRANYGANDPSNPNGFNRFAPPGEKSYWGLYTLAELSYSFVTLRGGERRTWYHAEALGGTIDKLESEGEATSVRFDNDSYEWGIELSMPLNITLFYNYVEAFRPPLIDEYFTEGPFSNCLFLSPSNICGDKYQPEEVESREIGASLLQSLGDSSELVVKLTVFESDVSNVLESIDEVANEFVQPGTEDRRGWELEGELYISQFFSRVGYSSIRGDQYLDGITRSTLYNLPGNRLTVLFGLTFFADRVETGYQYSKTDARDVRNGFGPNAETGLQAAYDLHDAYINFWATERLMVRLIGENLFEEEYELSNGFGGALGTSAPGRNFQAVLSFNF